VPSAFIAFESGHDYESTVRKAVSIGGDSDTIAAMAGSIAGPFYGVPPELEAAVLRHLWPDMREILDRFRARFG
jgi:ADP-ribosylglycohydrolase